MRPPAVATVQDAPPTIVTPNPLAALDEALSSSHARDAPSQALSSSSHAKDAPSQALSSSSRAKDAPSAPPPLARADSVLALAKRESDSEIGGGRAFPRSESAVSEAPAYVPRKRAKRAASQHDYDVDLDDLEGDSSDNASSATNAGNDPLEDAMTSTDLAAKLRERNQAPPPLGSSTAAHLAGDGRTDVRGDGRTDVRGDGRSDVRGDGRTDTAATPDARVDTPSDLVRPGSYLEYAMRAGFPRKGGTGDTDVPTIPPRGPAATSPSESGFAASTSSTTSEPPSRDSGFDIQPVPTKILNAALDFPEEKSGFDIQPVPTKILDAALRFDSESEAKSPVPPPSHDMPPAVPLPSVRPPGKAPLPPPGTPARDLPTVALGDASAKSAKSDRAAAKHAPQTATTSAPPTATPSASSATAKHAPQRATKGAPASAIPPSATGALRPSATGALRPGATSAASSATPPTASGAPMGALSLSESELPAIRRAESEFDYSSLALDNDASSRLAVQAPRANSALERALRDSNGSIDVAIDVGNESGALPLPEIDEDGDFGPAIAPVRTMQLAERAPSMADEDFERTDMPVLQLAVYEHAAHVNAAMDAVIAAGHAITVGTSEREGLERIGIAMTDGHIDAVLVGVPGGEVLIKAALSMAPWGPIVIASCSGTASEATRLANSVGADLVAIRPHDANRLGPVLLAAARILEHRRDLMAAQQGREEDLLLRLGSEAEPDEVGGLLGFDAFQRALELELKRVRRYHYPLSLGLFALDIESTQPPPAGIKGILRARAGNALLHSIRDIDMATELDQDRFLVLLPYTDLRGATEVARRIIGSVGAIAPVVAAGGEFQPKLVGAIAGAHAGQQLSFNKLIRDAQRALEAARRDGAELAVQP